MARRTTLLTLALACGAGLAAWSAWAGTQQCNTACQSRMTDCILGCDGRVSCELACKSQAVVCVNACTSDAGASERLESEAGVPTSRDGGSDAPGIDARPDGGTKSDAARDAAPRDR